MNNFFKIDDTTMPDLIKKGGATLYRTGGGFYDMSDALRGYAVSKIGGITLSMDMPMADMVSMVNDFASKMNGGFLGLWVSDNNLYVDTTYTFNILDNALAFAKDNGQLAIYDFNNKKEIKLND
jgi:hypothetical protein